MTNTTETQITYYIHPKENFYFALSIFFSIILYYLLGVFIYRFIENDDPKVSALSTIAFVYAGLIIVFVILRFVLFVGYVKGNAVKVSQNQFPDIYNIAVKQAAALKLSSVPSVYILQSGGVLNAFATSLMGKNYVVIYSDVLAAAYEQNMKVVEFIIGHEMGHIKRKHLLKHLLLFPSVFIPFLGAAYSRGCEYTCDSIGHAMCPEGARPGMLLLAAGKGLFKKVDVNTFIAQHRTEQSASRWIAEKFASHPNLPKRVEAFNNYGTYVPEPVVEKKETRVEDPSRYMPS